MPFTEKSDTKRLSEIESSLDSAFEGELHLESISQGAAREALLDVTELLLTGQGRQIDKDSGAMSSYTNNLTKSASSVLRQIERFAPVEQFPFLDSWNSTIRQCISTCSFFAVVEDAFFTCWKGYSTARINGQNVTFEPLGSTLDARLRFFRAYDDFEDDSKEQFDMKLLTAPDVMEGVARSIMATEFKKMGGFEYVIELPVVQRFADEYERVFTVPLRGALEIDLGLFTARDLLRAWCRLLSLARLHWMVRLLTSDAPNLPQTSLVFPALYRKKQFWLGALSGLPQPEKLLSVLTFDPVEKAGDLSVTPLVRIQEGYFGLVPFGTLHSNVPRNLLILIASRFTEPYSAFSLTREKIAIDEYRRKHPALVIDDAINLPKWKGKQLPDIDLLLANGERTHLVVAELKWQLSASSTREVAARNDYLKKGMAQLLAIRDFITDNPRYLMNRGLISSSTDKITVSYLLLCKGHLGSETVMSPSILMCDNGTFLNALDQGVAYAIEAANGFEYLPREGEDFTLRDVKVKFGRSVVAWKAMLPPTTTDDTESALIEAFYLDGARFAVL